MDKKQAAEDLLGAVLNAIKEDEKLMQSDDEDVKVFSIDAVTQLTGVAMVLVSALGGESGRGRNPMSRRVRGRGEPAGQEDSY